ncbi:MAG: thiamine pyrophosphate-binding protein [Gammaproteobacteria bacterium]|nr:thiamine pyrophosphate-binding protein [Gammaproteobacteria bacterium]MBU1601771.1 thiamine pyrophosphate-binding protein [Gammaproteobacteria bacterium]MBU2432143.1 thiamine pyrophosphate-binding protein [Gammaproteobacteria bacterium]MBU2450464.1 thiamine pyrophosphate-binding protein [Gammaproteobacteria bacterium]
MNSRRVGLAYDASYEEPYPQAVTETPQVADLIVSYLEQMGIEYVFGVPGGAIEPLYNALARSSRRGGPRPMVARHEAGAAFMADGYTRETGKIGVCCATSGPGATNLITGVACAYDNGIPMLVITGQPSLPSFGKRALQESACTGINTLGMFRHCTRYNSLISHPEQIESKLITALQRAVRAPRGPVHLSIPLDIMKSPSPVDAPSYDIADKIRPTSLLDADATDELINLIKRSTNIRLLIGGSCGEAIGSILQFAALRDIPFVTTPDGKGLINPAHPLFRGVFGFAGHATAKQLLNDDKLDLILAVGTSMNEWTSSGWSDTLLNDKLVHIDESAEHLARSPMARLHVRGRLRSIFDRLIERTHKTTESSGFEYQRHQTSEGMLADPKKHTSPANPITPQRLMYDLGRLFPSSTRFLADAGNSVAWSIHYLNPVDRRSGERRLGGGRRRESGRRQTDGGWLRLTMDFAPMGWAIGGAIGTAAGNPDVPVVCITGDGSLMMNGQELSVAVAEGLTVIFVILNDQALGMVKHGQRLAGAEQIGYQLPTTDFAAIARAMGADGYTVRSPEDMEALDIDAICKKKGPSLLDVYIDPEEVPPMNLRMQILGTDM